jgi:methyltransferase
MIAALALVVALLLMGGEQLRSRANERILRARGAIEPPDDVYRAMAWVYPAAFIAMGVEGFALGRGSLALTVAGGVLFGLAKLFKCWAIASLGHRWTFRVLVTDEPLVGTGPYALVRHPNYVAVLGELIGFAALAGAPVSGVVSVLLFGELLRRRIAVEDHALRR